MMIGTATVRCTACGARHEVPIRVRSHPGDDANVLRLHVADVDQVTLLLFADAAPRTDRGGPMTISPFGCRCPIAACTQRATQEDMRCDTCRSDHIHMTPLNMPPSTPSPPFALAEPLRLAFHD